MGPGPDEIAGLRADLAAAREELRRTATELRRSEINFEHLVREMPVPALIHREKKFILVNRAFTSVLGYEESELLGRSLLTLVDGSDRDYVAQRLSLSAEERSGVTTREHRLLHKDGSHIPVEVTSVPVSFRGEVCPMGVVRDLRERKRLEANLITADRLASLGRLSAAIGHEINNPLAYLLGSLELAEKEVTRASPDPDRERALRDLLATTREGAERIRTIVHDLRLFSREPASACGAVELTRVLDVCAAMAEHEVRPRARLVKAYAAGLPRVTGSESRLGQVFLNLLINAAEAIPPGDVEKNEVRIEARELAAGAVAVDVVDTGTGVPAALLEHIFEPFVTAKTSGTGLGLSISQHIVASLGGSIAVLRNEPRGSRFRVVLPCEADADVATAAGAGASPRPVARISRGLGRASARLLRRARPCGARSPRADRGRSCRC